MQMNYISAIRDAQQTLLQNYKDVLLYGLGVTDPKGIFGSTIGLEQQFGSNRVFDVPLSENAMTGLSIGLSIGGYRPIFIHQRLDFFLLAMDQLVNSAAKWNMMFGGQISVPIVIRLIVGRGWGQGPTHAQSLHSWFAHIPGLKVVMPFSPSDAKGLMISSVLDPNPVLFIEHRWLHQSQGEVKESEYTVDIGKANVIREGKDITILGISLMNAEALKAAKILQEKYGISSEVIDLRTVRPIDWNTIHKSVKKTGAVIATDISHGLVSVASEIISNISQSCFNYLKYMPKSICYPDHSVPTSHYLTSKYYPDANSIVDGVCEVLGIENAPSIDEEVVKMKDIPGDWFKGPF